MLFTRLPLWKLHGVDASHFRRAAQYWPFAGWITGSIMCITYCAASQVLPPGTAMLAALGMRMLLTGALHEDGLADFCDGMGGGRDRAHILSIMKDSHIGTFGVLGLIIYILGMYSLLSSLSAHSACLVCPMLLTADVWSKSCAAMLTGQLTYARREEEAKTRVVYAPMQWGWQAMRTLLAMAPIAYLCLRLGWMPHPLAMAAPLLTELLMMLWMRRRLQGYTGDCCGATFLLCEASFYMASVIALGIDN